jgi:hypothetical protein
MRSILRVLLFLVLAGPALATDGVLEINQACALAGCFSGDAPGFPVTINASAGLSYRLTSDLAVGGTGADRIQIQADHVTLDLNGFTIRCLSLFPPCPGNGSGIGVNGQNSSNLTVRNGTVRDMPANGVKLIGSFNRIDDVRAIGNGGNGIEVGNHGRVEGSLAVSNKAYGIFGGNNAVVITGNTANENLLTGISTGDGAIVSENIVYKNGVDGISALTGSLVSENLASDNVDIGIRVSSKCLVQRNVVRGSVTGISLEPASAYRENVVNDTTGSTIAGGVDLGDNSCNGTATCP